MFWLWLEEKPEPGLHVQRKRLRRAAGASAVFVCGKFLAAVVNDDVHIYNREGKRRVLSSAKAHHVCLTDRWLAAACKDGGVRVDDVKQKFTLRWTLE